MYYLAVLALFFSERFIPNVGKRLSLPFTLPAMENPRYLLGALLALVTLFALRLAAVYHAVLDPQVPLWFRSAPIPVIADARAYWHTPYRLSTTYALAIIATLSCTALFVLHRSLQARGTRRMDVLLVAGAGAIMLACALFAPGLGSSDPYLYVGYAKLGLHAYSSQPLTVPCEDSQPNAWCNQPVFKLPAVYGPLFLLYLHALIGASASTLQDLFVLRFTNIIWFALFILLLVRLKVSTPLVAVAALNPLFLAQYVADSHNDIICVDFALAGALALQRAPWLTMLCCAAASLIKLPFALFGALPFTVLPFLPRLLWTALTLALSLLMSKFLGGQPYADAVNYHRFHISGLASAEARMAFLEQISVEKNFVASPSEPGNGILLCDPVKSMGDRLVQCLA